MNNNYDIECRVKKISLNYTKLYFFLSYVHDMVWPPMAPAVKTPQHKAERKRASLSLSFFSIIWYQNDIALVFPLFASDNDFV